MLEYIVISIAIASLLISLKKSAVITISITLFVIFFIEIAYFLMGGSLYEVVFDTSDPDLIRFFTSLFVHANAPHIIVNVLVFLLVGIPLEDKDGNRNVLIYYFLGGIAGNLFYYFANLSKGGAILGASGCIFGILGAFIVRYPNEEISMFLGFIFMRRVKAKYAILTMAVIETLAVFMLTNDNVAHIAHVGGFVAGVFIGKMIPKYEVGRETIDMSFLYELADSEEDRKYVEKILGEEDYMVKKALLESFLEKKCRNYTIKEKYVICDGKKYKFQILRRR